jgi:hypothetical protein
MEGKLMITGDITLIENSTAGNAPRTFTKQKIEIEGEPPTVKISADGYESIGHHPTKITWYGGTVEDVDGITDVKIVSQGRVVIDGAFNTFVHQPHAISGGVVFYVLEGD